MAKPDGNTDRVSLGVPANNLEQLVAWIRVWAPNIEKRLKKGGL